MDKETLEYVAGLQKTIDHYEERFRLIASMLHRTLAGFDDWGEQVRLETISNAEAGAAGMLKILLERLEGVELPPEKH